MMFCIRNLFVGMLCLLLCAMPVLADGKSSGFIDEFVGHMNQSFGFDASEEEVEALGNTYHSGANEKLKGQMDSETQKFVGALCKRMQKHIRDNHLDVSVFVDVCGVSNKNALDIDCGSTDSCMVLIVPQMAKAIEAEESFISEQRIPE